MVRKPRAVGALPCAREGHATRAYRSVLHAFRIPHAAPGATHIRSPFVCAPQGSLPHWAGSVVCSYACASACCSITQGQYRVLFFGRLFNDETAVRMSTPTTASSPMFRNLRYRMTILNASTTVVLIIILRLMTASRFNETFEQAADAAIYERLTVELVQQGFPITARLTTYEHTRERVGAGTGHLSDDMDVASLTDTAKATALIQHYPNILGTYVVHVNDAGLGMDEPAALAPYPVQQDSLTAAKTASDRFDVRTVVDDNSTTIRIVTYVLPVEPARSIQVGRPMSDYVALEGQIRSLIVSGSLVGMVVVVIASWLLSRSFVAPTAHAYEQQRRFITNASHELRTPLSIVRTSAQIALLEAPPDHPNTELLHTIVAENRHMTNMIDNLLSIASTEERIPNVAAYDVVPLLREALKTVQQAAPERDLSLVTEQATVLVRSDSQYVRHIIRILLDNAIAHTSATAKIAIHVVHKSTTVELHVRDTGTGVPAEYVATIFEPFVSYGSGTGHRGSGIGLNIALTFARALRAQLRYEENTPQGACFILQLPV